MQIERLLRMVFFIINREQVTAKELADYFNVSTRTIYRDIDTLTLAGIPILSKKGTGGGISLMKGYTLNKSLLSNEDQQQIFQGLQILQASNYPNAEEALNKIGAVFKNKLTTDWLEVDFSYWGSDEAEKINISELQYAILNKRILAFDYFNSELQQSARRIEPLRLVFKSHAWYIVGFCHKNQELRVFRLSRMKNLSVLSENFERELPSDYSLSKEYVVRDDFLRFKLKFSPVIAYRLFDEFHEDQVNLCEDGNYLVDVRYPLSEWTLNHLLSFGPYVEVLEPAEVRTKMKERALEIVRKYGEE